MDCWSTWLLFVSLLAALLLTGGVELTFELADNAKECFYQEIEKNVSSTLEFQVRLAFSLHSHNVMKSFPRYDRTQCGRRLCDNSATQCANDSPAWPMHCSACLDSNLPALSIFIMRWVFYHEGKRNEGKTGCMTSTNKCVN